MGITTTRVDSLSILDHIILIATVPLDRRQQHSRS